MATENESLVWCDLHCHVLPGIDDGCKTPEESAALLRRDWEQGVRGVIATPHYYPRETISAFLIRRAEAEERLRERLAAGRDPLPRLCCGAEAAYHVGLAFDEELESLCLGNSRFLLLEMPFAPWPPKVLRDITEIIGRGITPVIAHIERYLHFQTPETARELFGMNVLIQMNADTIAGRWKGRDGRRMILHGQIDVLGSDAHNLKDRPPNLGTVTEKLARSRLGGELESIRQRNEMIFEDAIG